MTMFDDLKSQWEKQSSPSTPNNGVKQVIIKINTLKKNKWMTTSIISITALVLIIFFFYISAFMVPIVTIGLLLMIVPLLFRIFLEISSVSSLNKIDLTQDASNFKDKIIGYYKFRIKVNFIATPIILLLYVLGFVLLLPSFKANLSSGFYAYIQVSSLIILFILGVLIANTIRKEMSVLKQLSNDE